MVPQVFVSLDAIPLTSNAKVDRRALPAPAGERPELPRAFVAPRTPTEEKIAEIWRRLLAIDRVGADDDFFRLLTIFPGTRDLPQTYPTVSTAACPQTVALTGLLDGTWRAQLGSARTRRVASDRSDRWDGSDPPI